MTIGIEKMVRFGASEDLLRRLEAHVDRMRAANPGMRIDMSTALRTLLMEGLTRAENKERERPQPELPLKESSTTKT